VRVNTSSLFAVLFSLAISVAASGQVRDASKNQPADVKSSESPSSNLAANAGDEAVATIWIHLVGGGMLDVQEMRETADGIWYTRGGVTALLDPKRVAKIERPSSRQTQTAVAPEAIRWAISDAGRVERFFVTKFGRPLPISAFGQSPIHNRWGLDHRQGIDVGLHPDSREGTALVEYLRSEGIPFLVFRGPVPGVATGPHIHIGKASHRYLPR
jgi:hypothetical protein